LFKPPLNFKNCSHVRVIVHCRTQHNTVLIISLLILQTIIIAHTLSTGGEAGFTCAYLSHLVPHFPVPHFSFLHFQRPISRRTLLTARPELLKSHRQC